MDISSKCDHQILSGIIYLISALTCSGCLSKTKTGAVSTPVQKDTLVQNIRNQKIPGYRFRILGDFNGDGTVDTLTEHFYSYRDSTETNKYFSGSDDLRTMFDSVYRRRCVSFLLCSDQRMDTTPIHGIFGPIWLKNEGDLDGDGCDDLSFVESLPHWSSINQCHIIGFKNNGWQKLYSFEIREWQFPPLPKGGRTYTPFGAGKVYSENSDSINALLQNQLDKFPGPITKLPSGKIQVKTFTEQVEDTVVVVDLRR